MIGDAINEIRRILDLHNRDIVAMVSLRGVCEYDNFSTGVREFHETQDTAFVFLGPRDKLTGTLTYNDDETVTMQFTFPSAQTHMRSG